MPSRLTSPDTTTRTKTATLNGFSLWKKQNGAQTRCRWNCAGLHFSSWGETRTPDPGIMSAVL
jgi:hypothetical protein